MQIVSRWVWPNLGFDLLVTKRVIDLFERYKQSQGMKESGGQLFVNLSSPEGLVLSDATPPNKNDRATPTSLLLAPTRCREEIKELNCQGLFLVGYWHTHSEDDPQLSSQDLRSFQKFKDDNCEVLPYPLAVIVGQSKIRVWSMRECPFPGDIQPV